MPIHLLFVEREERLLSVRLRSFFNIASRFWKHFNGLTCTSYNVQKENISVQKGSNNTLRMKAWKKEGPCYDIEEVIHHYTSTQHNRRKTWTIDETGHALTPSKDISSRYYGLFQCSCKQTGLITWTNQDMVRRWSTYHLRHGCMCTCQEARRYSGVSKV